MTSKINVCRLKFSHLSQAKKTKTSDIDAASFGSSLKRASNQNKEIAVQVKYTALQKKKKEMCVRATGVFLHKHAECYSTFVSGADSSLANALLTCKQQPSENVSRRFARRLFTAVGGGPHVLPRFLGARAISSQKNRFEKTTCLLVSFPSH